MIQYLFDLRTNPRVSMPRKPKKNLNSLKIEDKKNTKLTGLALHMYLIKHLIPTEKIKPMVKLYSNLNEIKAVITSRYDHLKAAHNAVLLQSLKLGEALNIAFEIHTIDHINNIISITGKKWLDEEIGICDRYVRKLRELAKSFGDYPLIKRLALSFNEVYSRRNDITNMLVLNPNIAKFWRGEE